MRATGVKEQLPAKGVGILWRAPRKLVLTTSEDAGELRGAAEVVGWVIDTDASAEAGCKMALAKAWKLGKRLVAHEKAPWYSEKTMNQSRERQV